MNYKIHLVGIKALPLARYFLRHLSLWTKQVYTKEVFQKPSRCDEVVNEFQLWTNRLVGLEFELKLEQSLARLYLSADRTQDYQSFFSLETSNTKNKKRCFKGRPQWSTLLFVNKCTDANWSFRSITLYMLLGIIMSTWKSPSHNQPNNYALFIRLIIFHHLKHVYLEYD